MSGYPHHHFRPSTGDFNWAHPPPPPPPPPPQYLHPNFPSLNPATFPPPPPPPQPPNPNFIFGDLNTFLSNLHGLNFHPTPTATSNFTLPNPSPTFQSTPPFRPPTFYHNPTDAAASRLPAATHLPDDPREVLQKIDVAVETIRDELVAAGRSVSSWKVLQSALLRLSVDAETCLRLRVEQLPSLHRLMVTEGRVNAFIHCFVKVRNIISLYDLEVAICKNEDIERFEELGLGPLLRHPLVLHYFAMDPETAEVFKISTEEIIRLLSMYLKKRKIKEHSVEGFLDFIVTKRHVERKEKLGIRIFSLGVHASAMREAKASERAALWKSLQELKPKKTKRSKMRYLSKFEESSLPMLTHPSPSQKHNESNESVKKKRKYENLSCPVSVPSKLCKREKVVLPTENCSENEEVSDVLKLDYTIGDIILRMFITTWKEPCKEQPVAEAPVRSDYSAGLLFHYLIMENTSRGTKYLYLEKQYNHHLLCLFLLLGVLQN